MAVLALAAHSPQERTATTRVVIGECIEESHIAEGPVDADLTERQSRFFCDSVAISTSRPSDGRVWLQFAETRGVAPLLLGFSGVFTEEGTVIEIDTVYIGERRYTPNDAYCLVTYVGAQLADIVCGAQIDMGGRRIVPVVGFEVSAD